MSTRDDSSDPLIPNINEGSFSLERVGEQQFDDDYYSAPKKSKSSCYKRAQKRIWALVDVASFQPIDAIFHIFFGLLIFASLALAIATSEPAWMQAPNSQVIADAIEIALTAIFAVEWVVRLWACVADDYYHKLGPVYGRLRWIVSFFSLTDLASIIPTFVLLILQVDRNQYGGSFLVGRIFRLARLIKATRYVSTFEVFASAFRSKKVELATALTLTMGLCLVIATVMHYAEGQAQPHDFGSIGRSLYWAVLTLSTVGGVPPVTPLGKVITGISAFIAVALFALPAGVIGSAFVEELQKRRDERQRKRAAAERQLSRFVKANETTIFTSLGEDGAQENEVSSLLSKSVRVKVAEAAAPQSFEEVLIPERTLSALKMAVADNFGRPVAEILTIMKVQSDTLVKRDIHVENMIIYDELLVTWDN